MPGHNQIVIYATILLSKLGLQRTLWISCVIDQFHKSQNAPVPYLTMFHSEQKCAHFCSGWSILGNGTGACWHLGIRSILFSNGLVPFVLRIFARCRSFCWGLNASNEYSQFRINSREVTSLDIYCVRCCELSTCLLHDCWLSELLSILKISPLNITR